MTVLLLTSTVFAAKQDFDQKEFKASWKYASKQIAKNKYVLNGMVDKATIEKNIKTFLKEKYQQKQKVAKWKIRTAIRNEVNELRKSEKAQNNKLKVLLTSVKTKANQLESYMPGHEQTLVKKPIKPQPKKQEKPKDELQTELEEIQEKLAKLSK